MSRRGDHLAASLGVVGSVRTASLLLADLSALATLWTAQFFPLERVLFRSRPPAVPEPRI